MGKLVMLLGLIVLYIESHTIYFTIFKLFLFSLFFSMGLFSVIKLKQEQWERGSESGQI